MINWLRSLFFSDIEFAAIIKCLETIEHNHAGLEKAFSEFQTEVRKDLSDLSEATETKARRAPSGRPFHLLRSLAEEGARRKSNESH